MDVIWEQKEGGEGEEMAAKQYPPTKTRPKPFTKKTYDFSLQNNYFLCYYALNHLQKKTYNLLYKLFSFYKTGQDPTKTNFQTSKIFVCQQLNISKGEIF